jgi:hypothetical protein
MNVRDIGGECGRVDVLQPSGSATRGVLKEVRMIIARKWQQELISLQV